MSRSPFTVSTQRGQEPGVDGEQPRRLARCGLDVAGVLADDERVAVQDPDRVALAHQNPSPAKRRRGPRASGDPGKIRSICTTNRASPDTVMSPRSRAARPCSPAGGDVVEEHRAGPDHRVGLPVLLTDLQMAVVDGQQPVPWSAPPRAGRSAASRRSSPAEARTPAGPGPRRTSWSRPPSGPLLPQLAGPGIPPGRRVRTAGVARPRTGPRRPRGQPRPDRVSRRSRPPGPVDRRAAPALPRPGRAGARGRTVSCSDRRR